LLHTSEKKRVQFNHEARGKKGKRGIEIAVCVHLSREKRGQAIDRISNARSLVKILERNAINSLIRRSKRNREKSYLGASRKKSKGDAISNMVSDCLKMGLSERGTG